MATFVKRELKHTAKAKVVVSLAKNVIKLLYLIPFQSAFSILQIDIFPSFFVNPQRCNYVAEGGEVLIRVPLRMQIGLLLVTQVELVTYPLTERPGTI